jgi:hypothetical protein
MIAKSRATAIIMTLIICLSLGFSMTGCKGTEDLLTLNPDQVKLTSNFETEQFIHPGTDIYLSVHCENTANLPEKPIYVWTILYNQTQIEEITHGSEMKVEPPKESSYGDSPGKNPDPEYSWPNIDDLSYKCTNEGTYTIRVSLYDSEEYTKDKNTATLYSSYTFNVYSEHLRVSLKAAPTENSREYHLQATIENRKHIKYYAIAKWQFLNDITGQADTGTTEELTIREDMYDPGTQEVVHQFQQTGKYRVVFTLNDYDGFTIASAETVVDINQDLQIITPSGLLKTGEEYTFTARTDSPENLPDAPVYEWEFGDNNGKIIPFSNEATHLYEKEGTYTVRVLLLESDEEAAPLLGVATAEVQVEAGNIDALSFLQQTTHVLVTVRGDSIYHQSDGSTSPQGTVALVIYSPEASISWDGTHFSGRYFSPPTDHSSGITVTFEGDVSEEGDKIFNLTATGIHDYAHRLAGEQHETRISIVNVMLEPKSPIPSTYNPDYKPQFTAYIEGPEVANYVNSTFFEHLQPQTSDPYFKMWYDPLRFTNTNFTPYLLVVFKTERIDAYDDPGYQKRD